jgi:hypothetical protein
MNQIRRHLMQLASECFMRELTARDLLNLPIDMRESIAADAGLTPAELAAALRDFRDIEARRADERERDIERERKDRRRASTALRVVTRDD